MAKARKGQAQDGGIWWRNRQAMLPPALRVAQPRDGGQSRQGSRPPSEESAPPVSELALHITAQKAEQHCREFLRENARPARTHESIEFHQHPVPAIDVVGRSRQLKRLNPLNFFDLGVPGEPK